MIPSAPSRRHLKPEELQPALYELLRVQPPKEALIIVSADEKESELLADAAKFAGFRSFVLPLFPAVYGEDLRSWRDELLSLLVALASFYEAPTPKILIAPAVTAANYLPDPSLLQGCILKFGDVIDLDDLREKLHDWGYELVDLIEQPGEASVRGDILDIFVPGREEPVRISFFDDQIESMRPFDIETQKSRPEELEELLIRPALFSLTPEEYQRLNDEARSMETQSFFKDMASLGFWLAPRKIALPECYPTILSPNAKAAIEEIDEENEEGVIKRALAIKEYLPAPRVFRPLEGISAANYIDYHRQKKKITLLGRHEGLLKEAGIEKDGLAFRSFDGWFQIESDDEAFICLNKRQKTPKRRKVALVLDDLKPGDYVVHEEYGIGLFEGLRQVAVMGGVKDFLSIRYQGDDRLLVPVENIAVIDRYLAEGGSVAHLDRLGKGSFAKLKESVKAKLFEIAGSLIELAAKRELNKGVIIRHDDERLALFRADAGFDYTPDQQKCIAEIFNDLASGKVMDRLLTGDVGFGKTEVAMNALLATVLSGYQALFVVPTTLLATQHYATLRKRFDRFGVRVGRLDRYATTKEKNLLKKALEVGGVDIVVGTHALLDISCKNLGLVVIDEEHKFGVKQKEKLKALRENVHLLAMSATPIPRSLNMALSHLRGFSQILTPPSFKQDVRTYVREYNDAIVKEAILRELRRGGQIFYIHNRIHSIGVRKKALQELLPDLRIAVLHSEIPPHETEETMQKVREGEYDLLLSTSIVEAGIDMPRVNTMIVDSAETFGMADLHQLRGRVGRGRVQGFCYFLVEDKDKLSSEATRRLLALESNSYVGSGAALAFHDLEIRGGGNLLGEAQSGHIKQIGYSLYLRMLEEVVGKLSGSVTKEAKEVDLKLTISAFISPELVPEDRLRLELYRRFGQAGSVAEVYELASEIHDRFGALDSVTRNYTDLIAIKVLALEQGWSQISNYGQKITLIHESGTKAYLEANSKDDDEILTALLRFLRQKANK